jgi:hypothetical protein
MNNRKKPLILLLSDDLRLHSGIATMSREIVLNTVQKYDWLQIAAAINHPDKGKFFDISDSIKTETGIDDAHVKLIPNDGYGNADLLRQVLASERPDAILHFTDPRFWDWLYAIEDEVRRVCPIMYYSIWDDGPDPDYNHPAYGSCDAIFGISKQSYGIHHRILRNNGGAVIPLNSEGNLINDFDAQVNWDQNAAKNLW